MTATLARTNALLLPVGSRVVHIGPHKTGTTTVQFAFHAVRRELAAQGVFYPGPNSQPMYAVYGVTGQMPEYVRIPPIRRWTKLVAQLDQTKADRAVISSEGFCDADDAAIARIGRDLDVARTHVVVTLRPLTALLSSQWQQSVQEGGRADFDSWLRAIFHDPASGPAQMFWHRHRHDRLVERWARVVGPDHLTVIVIDERDHEAVLRVFEDLVGLRTGTLHSGHSRTNRSLTSPEIDLIAALNDAFTVARVDPDVRVRLVRDGVGELLKRRRPAPEEPRTRAPEWAREAAAGVSREIVDGIRAQGVRVVGSLEALAMAPAARDGGGAGVDSAGISLGAEIAAAAPLAVLVMSGLARRRAPSGGAPDPEQRLAATNGVWQEPIRQLAADADAPTISTTQIRRVIRNRGRRGAAEHVPAVVSGAMWARQAVRRVLRGVRASPEDLQLEAEEAAGAAVSEGMAAVPWRASTAGASSNGGAAAGTERGVRPAARGLTAHELEVVRAFDAAARHVGVDWRTQTAVIASVESHLRSRTPREPQAPVSGKGTDETASAADAAVDDSTWAAIGAEAALGTLFVSDLGPPQGQGGLGLGRAALEPLELARLSTGQLVRLLVRRSLRALRGSGNAT
jgi:hypothetical protein